MAAPQSTITGLLNINKPAEMTSRDVVNVVQRKTGTRKIGHAGTLDPMATGVLVLLLGQATRLTEYVQHMRKRYAAEFRFGLTSDTEDIWGNCEPAEGREITLAEIESTASQFVGTISQQPPKVSAVKIAGRRAYKLARNNQEFETKPREVQIHSFEITRFDYPNCSTEIECGSGTYIRSIARDLGNQLGCPAIMSSLIRTQIGPFQLENAVEINSLDASCVSERIIPAAEAVQGLDRVTLCPEQIERLRYGQDVEIENDSVEIAAIDQNKQLLAVLTQRKGSLFKPKINFVPNLS